MKVILGNKRSPLRATLFMVLHAVRKFTVSYGNFHISLELNSFRFPVSLGNQGQSRDLLVSDWLINAALSIL